VVVSTPGGEVGGAVVTFTTAAVDISAATRPALAAGKKAARLRGAVDADVAVAYRFEYGPTRRYGRATALKRLAPGASPVNVQALARGLRPGKRYHYRLVVIGPDGPVRGADRTVVVGKAALAVRRATTRGRNLRVTVRVPGPGRVTVLATRSSRGRTVTLGRTTARLRAAGPRTFTVRLPRLARQLKAVGRIEVTVTFTATGARAAAGRRVTL
jgi:hypothetical protein